MKRTWLTIISVILVLACVFGIYAATVGLDDCTGIMRYKKTQRTDLSDALDLIEKNLDDLNDLGIDRDAEEEEYAETVVTDDEGSKQLSSGEAQYNSGKAQYDAGKAQYDEGEAQYAAAKATYDEKKAEYDAAVKQLDEAKAQRDAAQQQLDDATAAYNTITSSPAYATYKSIKSSATGSTAQLDAVEKSLMSMVTGSYSTIDEVIGAYEQGQSDLADANAQIDEAEQQLASAKTQLDSGKQQLDAARSTLDSTKQQLDSAKSQLDAGQSQLAAGKQTMNENSEKMAEALEDLQQYDDAASLVEAGIAALMENEDIADAVADESDYESVIEAAREYLDEDAESVETELNLRQQMYNWLRILCILGVVAGVLGLVAAYEPRYMRLRNAAVCSIITAAAALILNIMGFTKGYQYFVYTLSDGSGDGSLQLTAMWIVFIAAAAAAIISYVCMNDYGKGMGVSRRAAKNYVEYDDEDDYEEPAPKKRSRYVEDDEDDYEEPAPRKRSRYVEDDEDDYEEPAPKKHSRYVEDDEDDYEEPAPKKRSRYVEDDEDDFEKSAPGKTRSEKVKTAVREEKSAVDEDYEAAKAEYEAARRKFEEARKASRNSKGN